MPIQDAIPKTHKIPLKSASVPATSKMAKRRVSLTVSVTILGASVSVGSARNPDANPHMSAKDAMKVKT